MTKKHRIFFYISFIFYQKTVVKKDHYYTVCHNCYVTQTLFCDAAGANRPLCSRSKKTGSSELVSCMVHNFNLRSLVMSCGAPRDTYFETGDPARPPAQLAGRRGQMNWNSVRRGNKYFVPGRPEQRTQKKNSCTDTTSPMNQPRKDPFHLYSLSPHSHQFQQSAGATPLSSLSGRTYRDTPKYYWYIDKGVLVRVYYVLSTFSPFFIKKMCDSNISCSFSTII